MDPRIHAALNGASRSCPSFGTIEVDRVHAQLDQAMCAFVNATSEPDRDRGIVQVSLLFHWYRKDFGGREGILDWLTHYLSAAEDRAWLIKHGERVGIRYSRYDWTLNGVLPGPFGQVQIAHVTPIHACPDGR